MWTHKPACPNSVLTPINRSSLTWGTHILAECPGEDETRKRPTKHLEKSSGPLVEGISKSEALEHDLEGQPHLGKSPW